MRTLTIADVTTPQATAFAELFPALSDAKTNGGAPLVELRGRKLIIMCHPAVGLDVARPAHKLYRAALVHFDARTDKSACRARVVGMLGRLLNNATVTA